MVYLFLMGQLWTFLELNKGIHPKAKLVDFLISFITSFMLYINHNRLAYRVYLMLSSVWGVPTIPLHKVVQMLIPMPGLCSSQHIPQVLKYKTKKMKIWLKTISYHLCPPASNPSPEQNIPNRTTQNRCQRKSSQGPGQSLSPVCREKYSKCQQRLLSVFHG